MECEEGSVESGAGRECSAEKMARNERRQQPDIRQLYKQQATVVACSSSPTKDNQTPAMPMPSSPT